MDAFAALVNSLLSIALQAFTLFLELILSILTFFVTFFQGLIGILHG